MPCVPRARCAGDIRLQDSIDSPGGSRAHAQLAAPPPGPPPVAPGLPPSAQIVGANVRCPQPCLDTADLRRLGAALQSHLPPALDILPLDQGYLVIRHSQPQAAPRSQRQARPYAVHATHAPPSPATSLPAEGARCQQQLRRLRLLARMRLALPEGQPTAGAVPEARFQAVLAAALATARMRRRAQRPATPSAIDAACPCLLEPGG